MEFGLRRAQGPDAGTFGARAAVIGGCIGTSNVICAKEYDVPALGTHAHSWIMSYGDELTAFRKYAELYPNNTTLLVDTYDTLRSGVPNAIRVFEELSEQNRMPKIWHSSRQRRPRLPFQESKKNVRRCGISGCRNLCFK